MSNYYLVYTFNKYRIVDVEIGKVVYSFKTLKQAERQMKILNLIEKIKFKIKNI